jgi:hypothetical protein
MKINAPLYSLNAGEVSKIAIGRVDIAKLRMAAECQVNWLPLRRRTDDAAAMARLQRRDPRR